jgi:hypothetical protein
MVEVSERRAGGAGRVQSTSVYLILNRFNWYRGPAQKRRHERPTLSLGCYLVVTLEVVLRIDAQFFDPGEKRRALQA